MGLIRHCIQATNEANGTPSSARIYAGELLITISIIQFMVVFAVMARLLTLPPADTNTPALTSLYLGFLKGFLLWTLLFDAATALSLYGVNVWKYLVALRTGVVPVEALPSPEGSLAPLNPPAPQTTNSSSSDIPQDTDRT